MKNYVLLKVSPALAELLKSIPVGQKKKRGFILRFCSPENFTRSCGIIKINSSVSQKEKGFYFEILFAWKFHPIFAELLKSIPVCHKKKKGFILKDFVRLKGSSALAELLKSIPVCHKKKKCFILRFWSPESFTRSLRNF